MERITLIAAVAAGTISLGATTRHVGTSAPAGTATTAPSTADASQPGEPIDFGLPPVTLVAPATTGAGDRPLFSWEPLEGAVSYSLAIVSVDDEPLWAWYGTTTEVILGGWPAPPIAEAPGPLLTAPSNWFVMAYDAAGLPIANSVLRPVAP